jgi:predicted transcriptional regulator
LANKIIIADKHIQLWEVRSLASEEMVVSGSKALEVAEALTATTLKILQLLSEEQLDISTIGVRLGLSEAYISEQIRILEDLKLIKVSYERGKRGIRKVCESAVKRITIIIKKDS